jgi:hypothetical protein
MGIDPWSPPVVGVAEQLAAGRSRARQRASWAGVGQATARAAWPPAAADRRFEADPLEILGDLDLPFGFYGVRPTLFDAPSRQDRRQLDWLAHSFLCISPGAVMERAVRPVAAFQWGFQLSNGRISLVPPSELALTEWDAHRGLLAPAYPGWRFDPAP